MSLARLSSRPHSDNRQPAKTYLEPGVPQKCPTDSYLVHGGIFMLLKIKTTRRGRQSSIQSGSGAQDGIQLFKCVLSRQVKFDKEEFRVICGAPGVMSVCACPFQG